MKLISRSIIFSLIIFSGCSNPTPETNATVAAPPDTSARPGNYPAEMNAGKTEIDSLVTSLFNAMKHTDVNEFIKLVPTTEETEMFYMNRTAPGRKEEMKKMLKQKDAAETGKQIMLDLYKKSIDHGKTLMINWSKIKYSSSLVDSSDTGGIKVYTGKISFEEHGKQFSVGFGDCFKINGKRLVLGNLALPEEEPVSSK